MSEAAVDSINGNAHATKGDLAEKPTENPTEGVQNHEKEFNVVDENGEAVELTDEEYQRLKEDIAQQDAEMDIPAYQPPQLDHKLAAIEEQFRNSFDERLANPQNAAKKLKWEDPTEAIRTNKIFREVSRGLSADWCPIFDELVAPFPKELVDIERAKIASQPVLIQGYKALLSWRDLASRTFNVMKLVEALRNNNMDDIADAVIHMIDSEDSANTKDTPAKPVQRRKSDVSNKSKPNVTSMDNRRLLLVAKKLGGDWTQLGKELKISEEDMQEIREAEKDSYQGAFKLLWAWKETQQANGLTDKEVENLKAALEKVGKKDISDELATL